MSADVITFPKAKRPRPFDDCSAACAKASGEALIALAAESAAARERGDRSPAMQQITAIANLFTGDE